MPLHLIKQNILEMDVDAIVNSTNRNMVGLSGVDKLLHDAGGPQLEAECEDLRNKCMPGEGVYTNAYNLKCKYIIHTVSLPWQGGDHGETAILCSCYKKSLEKAAELNCKSVAFPLIASGNYGYPVAEALKNAVTSINEYLSLYGDMEVYLTLYGEAVKRIADSIYRDLDKHIEKTLSNAAKPKHEDLDTLLRNPGESFVEMLYRFMNEKGIDAPSSIYKKAGMTKGTYSKLISGGSKNPSIESAVGLAMALELSYEDAISFLKSAGIALSDNNKFDIIVDYYLKTGNHDVWDMDIQLSRHGYKPLLGD